MKDSRKKILISRSLFETFFFSNFQFHFHASETRVCCFIKPAKVFNSTLKHLLTLLFCLVCNKKGQVEWGKEISSSKKERIIKITENEDQTTRKRKQIYFTNIFAFVIRHRKNFLRDLKNSSNCEKVFFVFFFTLWKFLCWYRGRIWKNKL